MNKQEFIDYNQKWTNRQIMILIGLTMCMFTIFCFIHEQLPSPYMDEIFHLDQLHAYCAGNFSYVSIVFM